MPISSPHASIFGYAVIRNCFWTRLTKLRVRACAEKLCTQKVASDPSCDWVVLKSVKSWSQWSVTRPAWRNAFPFRGKYSGKYRYSKPGYISYFFYLIAIPRESRFEFSLRRWHIRVTCVRSEWKILLGII